MAKQTLELYYHLIVLRYYFAEVNKIFKHETLTLK